jgi:hypothetical protein
MYGEKKVDSYGTYDEITMPNPSNFPRSRFGSTASFDKNSDTLWLFGGVVNSGNKIMLNLKNNFNVSSLVVFNDLWKYDG